MNLTVFVKVFMNGILSKYHSFSLKREWRKLNPHNGTHRVGGFFEKDQVLVGNYTRGPIEVETYTRDRLKIGHFVSIAKGVKFIVGGNHRMDLYTTFHLAYWLCGTSEYDRNEAKGDIIVGDDVWIGTNSLILGGVEIGQGAVIAAGAIVTHDVEPYSVVGGVPAKFIRYRYNEQIRNHMIQIDWGAVDEVFVNKYIKELYAPISEDFFEILPKKRKM